jgi:hypothetical protein
VIAAFGLSALLGLAFLMHGANLLSIQNTYDIYASSLRFLAAVQIVLMLLGAGLLVPIIGARHEKKASAPNTIELKISPQQSLTYPINPGKNVTIELGNGTAKITKNEGSLTLVQ